MSKGTEGAPSAEDISVEDLHRMADDLHRNIREQELEEEP
jgi:hypothetical protein